MFRIFHYGGSVVVQQVSPEGVFELEPTVAVAEMPPGLYDDDFKLVAAEEELEQ